jgi:hypothetical protein
MKDNIPKQKINQTQMPHPEAQMRRVASRMEGSKNHGNRPVQKGKKS